jgi:hypothetical protein
MWPGRRQRRRLTSMNLSWRTGSASRCADPPRLSPGATRGFGLASPASVERDPVTEIPEAPPAVSRIEDRNGRVAVVIERPEIGPRLVDIVRRAVPVAVPVTGRRSAVPAAGRWRAVPVGWRAARWGPSFQPGPFAGGDGVVPCPCVLNPRGALVGPPTCALPREKAPFGPLGDAGGLPEGDAGSPFNSSGCAVARHH